MVCMIYDMIIYDMIYIYNIYLLTEIGLTPGGSSTVHIYTQTTIFHDFSRTPSVPRNPVWETLP